MAPLSTLLIISNDFRYCSKQFALQNFPSTAATAQYAAQGMTVTHTKMCVSVRACIRVRKGEKWWGREREESLRDRRERERRVRELPDLKRQIRASLKSITGEPCTDFISWKTCAAKGMQTDIDVWDWLISSFLKNVHAELQCWVCFGFVCAPSAHSILNASLPVTFFIQQIPICWKLISHISKIDFLGQMTVIPILPLFSTTRHNVFLLWDSKINEQMWHSGLLHLKQAHLVTKVALQNTSNALFQVNVTGRRTWLKYNFPLPFFLIRFQMGVVCHRGKTQRTRKVW